MQPLRNNNLSVYVSRCKQSSNQSQPIVILMLVRLNGKSVYRSFLSLCHTHTLSLSLLRLVPISSSTLFRARYFIFPFFLSSSFSIISRLAHVQRPAKDILFAGRRFVEMLPWTTRRVLETSGGIGSVTETWTNSNPRKIKNLQYPKHL